VDCMHDMHCAMTAVNILTPHAGSGKQFPRDQHVWQSLCVGLCAADSVVTLRATLTNAGNVALQNVTIGSDPPLPGNRTCVLQEISRAATAADWLNDTTAQASIPAGQEVVCTFSYPIGQAALETLERDNSSGSPFVAVVMHVNASASATLENLSVTASDRVSLAVAPAPGLRLDILANQSVIPTEPGMTRAWNTSHVWDLDRL
jgi:hypothetical protein